MERIENWDFALFNALVAAEAKPFSWADGGCVALAVDCITAITGQEPFERPCLTDALDAKRWLHRNGFDTLGDAIAANLEEVPIAFAGRGDIGVVDRDGFQTAAVCDGLHWVARSEAGLVRLPRAAVTRAFRV